MDSVNRMQAILRKREQELEVTRQQRFHQEKMAAVGSLAAAVAHEINNPIAAIQGVAESIRGNCEDQDCGNLGRNCHPDMILEHTRRIAQITRQLGDLTSRRSGDPEWVDVNNLLRSTVNFLSFDRRLRHARVETVLDPVGARRLGRAGPRDADRDEPRAERRRRDRREGRRGGLRDHLDRGRRAGRALHGRRQRMRHDAGGARARLRRGLHHQAGRPRQRHRALHVQGPDREGRRADRASTRRRAGARGSRSTSPSSLPERTHEHAADERPGDRRRGRGSPDRQRDGPLGGVPGATPPRARRRAPRGSCAAASTWPSATSACRTGTASRCCATAGSRGWTRSS